jgi:hypothetical protein
VCDLPSAARRRAQGPRLRVVPRETAAPRDDEVRGLSCAARAEAEARRHAMLELSRIEGAIDGRFRPRRVHHLSRAERARASEAGARMRDMPRETHDKGPRELRVLSSVRDARSEETAAGLRDLSRTASHDGAARSPDVQLVPPDARGHAQTRGDVRELSRRPREAQPRHAGVCDLPPTPRTERSREAAGVRDMPSASEAPGPTREQGTRGLRELPSLSRGTPARRSCLVHHGRLSRR